MVTVPRRRQPAETEGPVADVPPRTVLDDPGSTQIALFAGWIPAAVAAVIGGVVIAFLSGRIEALPVVAVSGTVVGYVVCLICLFGIAQPLAKRGLSSSAADRAFAGSMLSGAPAAIVVAVLGSIGLELAGIAAIVAVGFVIVVVAYFLITDSSGRAPLP